jgi:exodeoxyribonuclease VIII
MSDEHEVPPGQALYPDEDGVLTPHPVGLVDQTNDEYHDGPGISKSHLDAIASKSPMHYWHKYINPDREPRETTAAMNMGTAVHTAILEPDLLGSTIVQAPEVNKRTNAGKAEFEAFCNANKDKVIITASEYEAVQQIRDAVHRHPVASSLLMGGRSEQSVYAIDKETGELIKCRIDFLHNSGAYTLDVKTTDDSGPNGFGKSCANYRYPVQTAWYNRVMDTAFGEHPEQWIFLAVEKEPPYAIGIYVADYIDTARAAIAAQRDFERIIKHRRSGHWPDYGAEPLPLVLPSWAKF